MDNSFHQQENETQQSSGSFVGLQWLASLVRLTEEEQENTGIYLDGIRDK
ncbi:MAG: hypothetical protein HGA79_04320 [Anaerolineales bacterium]|nr:hypothetical protein [Anaerolineales bacterium]